MRGRDPNQPTSTQKSESEETEAVIEARETLKSNYIVNVFRERKEGTTSMKHINICIYACVCMCVVRRYPPLRKELV